MAEEQLVLFSLGNEEYAISITQVKEIIQYKSATKIPNSPDYMEGIISLRGKVLPVVELALRLGVTANRVVDRRALIVETPGREFGIVVDAVTEVIRLADSNIEPSPAMSAADGYIRGIGKDGTRLIILLDVNKLFDDDDLQQMDMAG